MTNTVVLGIVADLHGDLVGFARALRIFAREGVRQIICAGDIVDRGRDADRIIPILQRARAICVQGNHEVTVARSQDRWRASERADRLAAVGRIVSDATLEYITALPATARLVVGGTRLLVAHGTPWSDLAEVVPASRPSTFAQLHARYHADTDILILGHTHRPMHVRTASLEILNPGSVYGVTGRDSHTCATLTLPDRTFRVFDLGSGERVDLPITIR